VEILDAQSAIVVNTVGIQSEGRITAMAILTKAKRVAVAMDSGILDEPTEETGSATLNKTGGDLGSNVDVVQTRALSRISLAYDLRGRHLFLVGHSTSSDKRGFYAQGGCCWDIMIRNGTVVLSDETRSIRNFLTPLYNMPSNPLAVFRGLSSDGSFSLGVYNSTKLFGNVINFENYPIFSFNSHSVLVLGNDDHYLVWDGKLHGGWIRKQNRTRPDSSDKTVYKYLVRCEGKGLESSNVFVDATLVAKIAWDNFPPLTDVKGFVETDAGLTFILEGEKFIFFGKEP